MCSNMVGKALNGRTGTVQRASEALLTLVELEQSSAVVVRASSAGGGLAAAFWRCMHTLHTERRLAATRAPRACRTR